MRGFGAPSAPRDPQGGGGGRAGRRKRARGARIRPSGREGRKGGRGKTNMLTELDRGRVTHCVIPRNTKEIFFQCSIGWRNNLWHPSPRDVPPTSLALARPLVSSVSLLCSRAHCCRVFALCRALQPARDKLFSFFTRTMAATAVAAGGSAASPGLPPAGTAWATLAGGCFWRVNALLYL